MQTIRRFLTEIGGKFTDAGFVPHFRLRRIPDDRCHRKDREALIDQILKQELLIVQALSVVERRDERRSCQTPSCLLYTSPSPRDRQKSRMPSSA